MKAKKLGTNGPQVAAVGLGCMGMSEFYGQADDARSIAVIHRAIDLGMGFFDTADMYGSGKNEELLGRAIRDRRDRAVVATKFAIVRGPGGSFDGISGRPEYVREACDASLGRLGIDTIDLYYQHRVDPAVPIEETVSAMADLVKQGKVKHLGLSEASPRTVRRAHAVHPIAAVQVELSFWSRDPERELIATCDELGITLVAYSPIGRGFLTGQIRSLDDLEPDDRRRMMPRFSKENFPKNLELVRKIEELAKRRGVTAAQLALAWVLTRGENVIAIPGTTKIERLEENRKAMDIELTKAELDAIDAVAPEGVAAGERYDAGGMKLVDA